MMAPATHYRGRNAFRPARLFRGADLLALRPGGLGLGRIGLQVLALIILAKSLHCAAVESQFRVRAAGALAVGGDVRPTDAAPVSHLPLPNEEGCDTGCLCQGYIATPPVEIPPLQLAADSSLLAARIGPAGSAAVVARRINWLWHLDDFPGRPLSGRTLRQWFSSLTI